MQPPFGPILLHIGPLTIFWYGFLIATAILLGARVATFLADQAGEDPETIWDMLIVVIVLALIGARAYHVFSSPQGGMLGWSYYKQNPLQVFAIWNGGLGIYGGLAGGALGVVIFCWIRKLNVLQWLDFIAPGAALGQSIGRWGNFMNRELYGPPTTLPWGLNIPPQYRIPPFNDLTQYPESTRFQPTFLYESLACLALCVLLIWVDEALPRPAPQRRHPRDLPDGLRRHPLRHRIPPPRRLDGHPVPGHRPGHRHRALRGRRGSLDRKKSGSAD